MRSTCRTRTASINRSPSTTGPSSWTQGSRRSMSTWSGLVRKCTADGPSELSSAAMHDRSHLLTEQRLAESMNLDAMSVEEAVALMNAQDAQAVAAVGAVKSAVADAVNVVVSCLRKGGRLFYF